MSDATVAAVLRPRRGLVEEIEAEPGRLVAASGPVGEYERFVHVVPTRVTARLRSPRRGDSRLASGDDPSASGTTR